MFEPEKACKTQNRNCIPVGPIGVLCFILLIIGFYVSNVAMIGMGLWDKHQYKEVVTTEAVGRITGAAYQNPSLNQPTSAITTEKGTFLVVGVMQGIEGHRVRMETRGNGAQALCDEDAGVCKMIYPEDGQPDKYKIAFHFSLTLILTMALALTFWVSGKKGKEDMTSDQAQQSAT